LADPSFHESLSLFLSTFAFLSLLINLIPPQDEKLLAVLLSNRSQAYLSRNEPALALLDADTAIKMDPSFQKSLFRRGKALFDLERFGEAEEAFRGCEGQEKLAEQSAEHRAQVRDI
jgi:tetratricopeptide (TPR) repeat protein